MSRESSMVKTRSYVYEKSFLCPGGHGISGAYVSGSTRPRLRAATRHCR